MTYKHDRKWITGNKYWDRPLVVIDGLVLHSVGVGQPSADVFVKQFNTSKVDASVHGFIEPGRFVETIPIFESKKNAKRANHVGGAWNYTRLGIEMTEPGTIKYTGGAIFVDQNPTETAKFIKAVTATAAEVFADLCIFHEIPVSQISTHAEAHRLGKGSGHSDPEHIWKLINYTLDDFRRDVQKIIDEKTHEGDYLYSMTKEEFEKTLASFKEELKKELKEELKVTKYRYLSNVPDWARPAIEQAMRADLIVGEGTDNGGLILNLSYDVVRLLNIMYRQGMF